MNAITFPIGEGLTMSSREIAELTEKEHRNVLRDIKVMLLELHGELGALKFEHTYLDVQNKERPEYRLPKRETLVLVSGYSITLRTRIIDRWQELEARPAIDPMKALNDGPTLRHLLLGYTEKVMALENIVADLAPKAADLDRIACGEGSFSITEAAKNLQLKQQVLFKWLRAHSWIYRRPGAAADLGYQDKVTTGYLEHKATSVVRADGTEKYVSQVRITPKGLVRLAKEFRVNELLLH